MGVLTSYTDDTTTTSDDKYLTVDASGATKLTPASTLKTYIENNTTPGSTVTADIADGAVTAAKLAAEPWTNWTPTWDGISGGTLTYARWKQLGKCVYFELNYTLAGANISGEVRFSPPIAPVGSRTFLSYIGGASFYDASAFASHAGIVAWYSSTRFIPLRSSVSGSNVINVALSATAPFTWTTSDSIVCSGFYETS